MYTPYDWQEGIGHRASYVESRLSSGVPVVAISLDEGILTFTEKLQARKLFEIYDRLTYSAIGLQSDVESLRVAAIDFAHQEGYQRSEQDVTIQRVVSTLSQPLKKAFADFNTAPFVVRSLFAEVGQTVEDDLFLVLDFDGDFRIERFYGAIAGDADTNNRLLELMQQIRSENLKMDQVIERMKNSWSGCVASEERAEPAAFEIALLERHPMGESRFNLIEGY